MPLCLYLYYNYSYMQELFRKFSHTISYLVGTPWAFIIAITIIIMWSITGPLFGFSDTWQLVINTGTTIVTFLMVFLIQNTQNRESRATQLKLDELIRTIKGARNTMIELENMDDESLDKFAEEFQKIYTKSKGRRNTSITS